MKQLLFVSTVLIILVACNDAKPEKDMSIVPLNTATNSETAGNVTVKSDAILPEQINAVQNTGMPQTTATTPQNVVTSNTALGMNPPHGQPGHRCDVADGAPLSSAPARVPTAPTVQSNTPVSQPVTMPAASTPKAVTAKGMNPPHGEPGHRCDISVGTPLTSAPNPTAKPDATNGSANITPTQSPVQNTPLVPALQNSAITPTAKPAASFTGKVNPAHGQPGHDCKVAVGQPLP
ncbi:MAG: hypothetical protein ACKVOM_10585 [Ferruginibacter sp.]